MQSKTAYRILIVRWSGMGDVVMSLPAVAWLKNRFTDCHITYLTDRSLKPIIKRSGWVDRIETINRSGFTKPGAFAPALLSLMAVLWRLYRGRYDYAFDLQGFGETALLAYLSRAPFRIGRFKASFPRRSIYTVPIRADWGRDHRSLFFLRAVAGPFVETLPEIAERPRLQPHTGIDREIENSRIGLNIGASTESRRWSEQNFFQLADRLTRRGYRIRFFLGPQEGLLQSTVKGRCKTAGWELFSDNEIEPLIRNLSACALLVSNDTGPGHLAAALDVPVVSLFSTGTPENVGPLAIQTRWFREEQDINRIGVGAVEKACVELLNPLMKR